MEMFFSSFLGEEKQASENLKWGGAFGHYMDTFRSFVSCIKHWQVKQSLPSKGVFKDHPPP